MQDEDVPLIDASVEDQRYVLPVRKRNIVFGGLAVALRGLPAVAWTYALSLGIALLFSTRFYGQWNALLSHSLAAQSLTSAFDLGTFAGGVLRLSQYVPGGNPANFGGAAVFAVVWCVLVPGTLFCYAAPARARLSTLLRAGIEHFWRFVRIALLTLLVGGLVLGLLSAANAAFARQVSEHLVGRPAFLVEALGVLVVFLVATVVRLYFDLVEVYTVQLGVQTSVGPNARPDRRVRRALRPAWHTLRHHFAAAWFPFLLLTVLGMAALAGCIRFALESLAQPRVWPAFAVMQLGLLFDLFTRFWQRGIETVLAANYPLPFAPIPAARPVFTTTQAPPAVAPGYAPAETSATAFPTEPDLPPATL